MSVGMLLSVVQYGRGKSQIYRQAFNGRKNIVANLKIGVVPALPTMLKN